MVFEWDEAKRLTNIIKHGYDFSDAQRVAWNRALVAQVQDVRGEERKLVYAPLDGRLIVIIYTLRDDAMRLISMRAANRRERDIYIDASE